MKKYTIKTNLFQNENELNIFVQNVRDMRDAQEEYVEAQIKNECAPKAKTKAEVFTTPSATRLLRAISNAEIFETQIDETLKRLPDVGAIFL